MNNTSTAQRAQLIGGKVVFALDTVPVVLLTKLVGAAKQMFPTLQVVKHTEHHWDGDVVAVTFTGVSDEQATKLAEAAVAYLNHI